MGEEGADEEGRLRTARNRDHVNLGKCRRAHKKWIERAKGVRQEKKR